MKRRFLMYKFTTKKLARAGVVAALYVVLSLAVLPIASGAIQFRPSEALTILPLFFTESIPALFIGCMLSNLITGCAVWDIIFGSVISLVSGVLTYFVGRLLKNDIIKVLVGGIVPIILNALFLPLIWYFCYGLEYLYILHVLFLLASQSVVIYGLGIPLYFAVKRLNGTVSFFRTDELKTKEKTAEERTEEKPE